jgi:septal ring-binding cell division protein DamX
VKIEREPEPKPEPEVKSEPPRPIHITRTEVVEKIKPPPTVVTKPEPAKPEPAKTVNPAKAGEVPEPPVKKAEAPPDDGAYNAGLSAGKRWTSGKNSGQYTVQVLTTSAKEAQALVASLAAQHASRVTIVPAGADRVTIFYGNYPSMTEARQARGALPAALRQGGNPYAISVDGAMGRLKAR